MRLYMTPLLTLAVLEQLRAAQRAGAATLECSLDLQRSTCSVALAPGSFSVDGRRYGYPDPCRDRTIYHWDGSAFAPVQRYGSALIKLVPTDWGPPTFEIDGIKMLPTARVSPWLDAQRKVGLIQPRGKVVLDTCGGLGYFAAWCVQGEARQVLSYEKNAEVIWLRSLNPWSPPATGTLSLQHADVAQEIARLADGSVDAILHDPPRFGTAGELYSLQFYRQLARVLRRRGRLFHYTGSPNKLTSNRDVPREVAKRLTQCGFKVLAEGDGLLATKHT